MISAMRLQAFVVRTCASWRGPVVPSSKPGSARKINSHRLRNAVALRGQAAAVVRWLSVILLSFIPYEACGDIFENRMSMDTTPVEFSIGETHYKIPRNYLFTMDNWAGGPQELVSLRVEYPGLLPFSEKTKACFLGERLCRRIEFAIVTAQFQSGEEHFPSLRHLFHDQKPEEGPSGLELYTIGPESARIEIYRKVLADHTLVFDCNVFDNHGVKDGVCQVLTRTRHGGIINYRFSRQELKNAAAVDIGLRNLVDSFVTGESE